MTTPFLTNYRIPEIPVHRFCHLLEGIYRVLERGETEGDPLYDIVLRAHRGLHEHEYREREILRASHVDLVDNIALLHYDLAVCFRGWSRRGRHSDIVSDDDMKVIVWKSPFVPMRATQKQLLEYRISGKEVYMVGYDRPDDFRPLSVKEAYHLLSGRSTFWADLQSTLSYIFTNYKTYSALVEEIT
jgi:hypothetical protein